MREAEKKRAGGGLACHTRGDSHIARAHTAGGLLVVRPGRGAHHRGHMAAAQLRIGGLCMRVLVIRLPRWLSRLILSLRGE